MAGEQGIVESTLQKFKRLQQEAVTAIRERLAEKYAEKEANKKENAYFEKLERLAPAWEKLLGNSDFAELQVFLEDYRKAVLESLVQGSMEQKEAKGMVRVFDLIIHEPLKVVKEYEALKKALR